MSGTRRAPRPSRTTSAIASSPWIVVGAGVVVMVVLLAIALGAYRERSADVDGVPEPPAPPLLLPEPSPSAGDPVPSPARPTGPGLSPGAATTPTTGVPSPPYPTPAAADGAPRSTPSPAGGMTGRYRVVNSFDGGFIGEVLIRNGTADRRGWTVRLTYAEGRFVTAWVEKAEQGTASPVEGGFTYRSGVDLAPAGTATLRFHMERTGPHPTACTVDGAPCVIA